MAQAKIGEEERSMFVKLTPGEVAVYALDAARVTLDIGELEDQKKAAASTFKDRIDRSFCVVRELSRKVKDGQELRDVKCTWHADYETRKAFLIRDDTGEEIQSRDLTAQELQGNLPLKKAGGAR